MARKNIVPLFFLLLAQSAFALPEISADVRFQKPTATFDGTTDCPPGTRSLRCVESITIHFRPLPQEVGLKGFAAVVAHRDDNASAILNSGGAWIDEHTASTLEYSFELSPIDEKHSFSLPIPPKSLIDQFCPLPKDGGGNQQMPQSVSLYFGYGSVSKAYAEQAEKRKRSFKDAGERISPKEYASFLEKSREYLEEKDSFVSQGQYADMVKKRDEYSKDLAQKVFSGESYSSLMNAYKETAEKKKKALERMKDSNTSLSKEDRDKKREKALDAISGKNRDDEDEKMLEKRKKVIEKKLKEKEVFIFDETRIEEVTKRGYIAKARADNTENKSLKTKAVFTFSCP